MQARVSDEQLFSWLDRDASDLRRHLADHPEDAPRVDELRASLAVARTATALPESIGPFRVTGVLGRGGMGVVYAAVQDHPRREVAIKVIRPGFEDDAVHVRLFDREVESLGRLRHPGIATLYQAGVTPRGERWFAMERVDGVPLDRYLAERLLDLAARMELFAALAEIVAYAHAQGTVHRDLKPSNVFVDAAGRLKVLDFGLARDARSAATITGSAFAGTPLFMSPEQARGDRRVDARSDVYSLGVIGYRMGTGRSPYAVADDAPLLAVLDAICDQDPLRPGALVRGLRGDGETILRKALAKEPERRFADAGELAADVRSWLSHRPIRARPPSLAYRARCFVRRRRAAIAVVFVIGLALTAGLSLRSGLGEQLGAVRLVGDGYPELSPFRAVRWEASQPIVQVDDDRWYRVAAIAGEPIELIIGLCKKGAGDRWRKRFLEDLVQVLWNLRDGDPGDRVDLSLVPVDGPSVPIELRDVPMTAAKRRALWTANAPRAPFDAIRHEHGKWLVDVGGRRLELLGVAGLPAGDLLAGIGDGRFAWFQYADRFADVLRDHGIEPGATIAVRVRDPATGAVEEWPDAPMLALDPLKVSEMRAAEDP